MAAHTRERERERSFMQSVRGWGGGMVMRWVLCGRRRLLRSKGLKLLEGAARTDKKICKHILILCLCLSLSLSHCRLYARSR